MNTAKYDVVLREKPLEDGLTKTDIAQLLACVSAEEVIPIEFQGEFSTAMGFIALQDAEIMNYQYDDLERFVCNILNDMNNENAFGHYIYRSEHCDHDVWLTRG